MKTDWIKPFFSGKRRIAVGISSVLILLAAAGTGIYVTVTGSVSAQLQRAEELVEEELYSSANEILQGILTRESIPFGVTIDIAKLYCRMNLPFKALSTLTERLEKNHFPQEDISLVVATLEGTPAASLLPGIHLFLYERVGEYRYFELATQKLAFLSLPGPPGEYPFLNCLAISVTPPATLQYAPLDDSLDLTEWSGKVPLNEGKNAFRFLAEQNGSSYPFLLTYTLTSSRLSQDDLDPILRLTEAMGGHESFSDPAHLQPVTLYNRLTDLMIRFGYWDGEGVLSAKEAKALKKTGVSIRYSTGGAITLEALNRAATSLYGSAAHSFTWQELDRIAQELSAIYLPKYSAAHSLFLLDKRVIDGGYSSFALPLYALEEGDTRKISLRLFSLTANQVKDLSLGEWDTLSPDEKEAALRPLQNKEEYHSTLLLLTMKHQGDQWVLTGAENTLP